MYLYRGGEPPLAFSNSFLDIRVANDLSLWLNEPEALADATGGKEPAEVFVHLTSPIEELDSLAPKIGRYTREDPSITAYGLHPQWRFLTTEAAIPAGAYIGELVGRIGRKEDYVSDPKNRWDLLEHPEPFVFFPPHLPIYIDVREEGNIFRYIRRSCNPNVEMKICTWAPERGYHFCFFAIQELKPGEKLTMAWEAHLAGTLQILQNMKYNRKEGLEMMKPRVTNLLANFGGCACDISTGIPCPLDSVRRLG
jgi:hypothetical protein